MGAAKNWPKIARNLGYSSEQEMWDELYCSSGGSIKSCAERLECGEHTVRRRLSALSISVRTRGGDNNSTPPSRELLFHSDQRVVWTSTIETLTKLLNISPAVISNYRNNSAEGGYNGFLYHLTSGGA